MLTQEFTNQLKSFTGFESRNDFMLYPSGMLVVRPANDGTGEIRYTKHYYAGAERVSSKIGTTTNLGSFLRDWTLMENSTEFPENPVINGKEQLRKAEQAVRRVYTAFGMNATVAPGTDAFNPVFALTHQSAEPDQYYYHPDHLGSSSYITNADGTVNQHIEYFAFGETFVDEHLNSYNTPYKFNGKELDEETGWYYYGARYYDPRVSLWLGVDPMAEKYPSMSPFNYCFNNPVRLIDPTGMGPDDPDENLQYTIVKGDNFWKLENRWRIPHGKLQEINPDLDPNNLQIGQVINAAVNNGDFIIVPNGVNIPEGKEADPADYAQPDSKSPQISKESFRALRLMFIPLSFWMSVKFPKGSGSSNARASQANTAAPAAKGVFSKFSNLDDLAGMFKGKNLGNATDDLLNSGWTKVEGDWGSKTIFQKQIGKDRFYATWESANMEHSTNNLPTSYWKLTKGKISAYGDNVRRVSDAVNFKQ